MRELRIRGSFFRDCDGKDKLRRAAALNPDAVAFAYLAGEAQPAWECKASINGKVLRPRSSTHAAYLFGAEFRPKATLTNHHAFLKIVYAS